MSVEDDSSDDSSQSAPRSRQPLSNRADPENRPFAAPTVRLAEREGTKLREEVTYDSLDGVEAHTCATSTERWASWYEDSRRTQVVVENSKGERTGFRQPNRFTPEYREMLYAKAQSLERSLREKWGRLLHTGMITLTCSTTDDDGQLRPPVEHLRDLQESWEAVRRALSRSLDGREWERLAIIEPHKKRSAGYAHVHIGVFVKGPVVAEQFQPVLDAHLENCPTAGAEAHQLFDEDGEPDAVSVHRTADRRNNDGIENLGAYLSSYMAGEYGLEATEMPEYVQTFYTTMWATGTQWWRPSNGAQEYMQPEEPQDGDEELAEDWRLVGIAPEGDLDDEIIEIDPKAARGSVYRRLRQDRPPDALQTG